MNRWIVIPTYNEQATIEPLLLAVRTAVSGVTILIVDDNSPDGTGDLVERLRPKMPGLEILHRSKKTGLAAAYHDGLRHALDHGADRIVHMDADFSHDPAVVPQLLTALDDHDLAIASRYVPGGELRIPFFRRIISSVGNSYIRALLGQEIHDWSTGFKAWRADTLRPIVESTWQTVGYACLMEMSWRAKQRRARIAEVPLVFIERQAGQSKFSTGIALEDLLIAWRLRRSS